MSASLFETWRYGLVVVQRRRCRPIAFLFFVASQRSPEFTVDCACESSGITKGGGFDTFLTSTEIFETPESSNSFTTAAMRSEGVPGSATTSAEGASPAFAARKLHRVAPCFRILSIILNASPYFVSRDRWRSTAIVGVGFDFGLAIFGRSSARTWQLVADKNISSPENRSMVYTSSAATPIHPSLRLTPAVKRRGPAHSA